MTTFGVDVSKWQKPPLNWEGMRDNKDIAFAVARASIGLLTDGTYAAHTRGAGAAGLQGGAYHYLWPHIDPVKSVDIFLRMVGPLEGKIIVLDLEEKGTTYRMARAWAREFDRQSGGHPLGIYISRGFWIRIGKPRLADAFDYLWLAYWPSGGYPGDSDPAWDRNLGGFREATIWQYGIRRASGQRLDGDAYRKPISKLAAITAAPTPPDTTTGAPVTLELETTDPVLVSIPEGTQLYDLHGNPLRTLANAREKVSPYQATVGNRHFRMVDFSYQGVLTACLVQLRDVTVSEIPAPTEGATPEEVEQAVTEAIAADRASASIGIVYPD